MHISSYDQLPVSLSSSVFFNAASVILSISSWDLRPNAYRVRSSSSLFSSRTRTTSLYSVGHEPYTRLYCFSRISFTSLPLSPGSISCHSLILPPPIDDIMESGIPNCAPALDIALRSTPRFSITILLRSSCVSEWIIVPSTFLVYRRRSKSYVYWTPFTAP